MLEYVPPSGGSLEIGNCEPDRCLTRSARSSPFGGIPRNWKQDIVIHLPLGGSSSPFGGIPRNWKQDEDSFTIHKFNAIVPPSGGSLEIGNWITQERGRA